jgi:hypothetical protein
MADAGASTRIRLPFNALAKHLEAQVRGKTIPAIVNRYASAMKSGARFPPITVADINGSLVLIDGFHRRAALEACGEWEADAELIASHSLEDALWKAFDANLRHGQPLKSTVYRAAFRAYIRAGKNVKADGGLQSYREIATSIPGKSHSAYRRWMQNDFPSTFAAMSGSSDEAEGGLRDALTAYADPQSELACKAIEMLEDARALMDGVTDPFLRWKFVETARHEANRIELTGVGAKQARAPEEF